MRPVGDVRHDVHQLDIVERGEGPTVLYLHAEDGLQFSGPVLDALARDFHVVAPHLPGFGRSVRDPHVQRPRDIALVLDSLLDELGPGVAVVGSSLGAWTALELAIIAKDRITGLVLASPAGVKTSPRDVRDFADIWVHDHQSLQGLLYGPGAAPDWAALSDDDLEYLAQCQEQVARYCWAPYMYEPALAAWAQRVTAPTLVVHGEHDGMALTESYAANLAACIGPNGARVIRLDGVGRRLEEEDPSGLAALIRDHLVGSSSTRAVRGA